MQHGGSLCQAYGSDLDEDGVSAQHPVRVLGCEAANIVDRREELVRHRGQELLPLSLREPADRAGVHQRREQGEHPGALLDELELAETVERGLLLRQRFEFTPTGGNTCAPFEQSVEHVPRDLADGLHEREQLLPGRRSVRLKRLPEALEQDGDRRFVLQCLDHEGFECGGGQ